VDSQRRESLVRLTRCAAALMVALPPGCAADFRYPLSARKTQAQG